MLFTVITRMYTSERNLAFLNCHRNRHQCFTCKLCRSGHYYSDLECYFPPLQHVLHCYMTYLEGVAPTRGNDTGNRLEIDVAVLIYL